MTQYTLHVPVEGKNNVKRYPSVGVMLENRSHETDEKYFTIRLDFPVGATELLAFPPKEREAGMVEGDPPGTEKAGSA